MNYTSNTFEYKKFVNNKPVYGGVDLVVEFNEGLVEVIDDCSWKRLKSNIANFQEIGILELWKSNAIAAARSTVKYLNHPYMIRVIVKDVWGIYTDTQPSHIGAATIIGIFDLINRPLSRSILYVIDNCVSKTKQNITPNYDLVVREILEYKAKL